MNTYDEAFRLTVGHEGGYQKDYHDRGNWTTGRVGQGTNKGTKYGITAMSYPNLDIRNLSLEAAKRIYKRDFWSPAGCEDMPPAIAYLVFDGAVNHGVSRAVKLIQQAAGSRPDGDFGPKTLAAIEAKTPEDLAVEYCVRRMLFYTQIGTFDRYGLGWTRRAFKTLRESFYFDHAVAQPVPDGPEPALDESTGEDIYDANAGFWSKLGFRKVGS